MSASKVLLNRAGAENGKSKKKKRMVLLDSPGLQQLSYFKIGWFCESLYERILKKNA